MVQDKRSTNVGRRTGTGRKPDAAERGASRKAALPRGDVVISGGTGYERSMVGDRLEARGRSISKTPSVAMKDYDSYMSSFGGVSDRAVRKSGASRRFASQGRKPRRRGGRRGSFDSSAQGSTIREAATRFLPMLKVRVTASVLAAIIAGLVVYNVYMSFYVTYKTEKVALSPYLETIDVEGIAIRDEIPLEGKLSRSAVKAVQKGEKVSKGETIVNIFSSSQEAAAYERIAEIDRETEVLGSMDNALEDSVNAVDNIGKLLDSKMVSLNTAAQQRKISEIPGLKSDISYLLSKRMVAMKQAGDYKDRIKKLTAEKEELLKKYKKTPKTITAPDSGYFVDECDGYETLLKPSMASELTVEKLDEIMNSEVAASDKYMGKLVGSFTWYLACPVPANEADFLLENLVYTLYLPYSESESIKAELAYLNKVEGEDKFLAVFRCSSLASELCTMRRQPVKIQRCKYEGFMIKKSALHAGVKDLKYKNPHDEKDFPRGHAIFLTKTTYPSVYVIVAGQVREKEVSIIYGTDKMVICAPKNGMGDYLSLGDTVVVEERGLYNGKIVD